jgi:drug/metabolite transporter (DMT)-like permease
VFAAVWLRELPRWNEVVAFGLILASVVVANLPRV